MMQLKRNEEFDVLRAFIIINAVILHFTERFDLGLFSLPSKFIQVDIFNVGSFFFFTAGYMAYKIYLPRFEENRKKTTAKIIKKGIDLFLIYICYITLMRLDTGTQVPLNIYDFIFSHSFYTKVLFTFSFLYILSPFIIGLYLKSKRLFLVFGAILLGVYIAFVNPPLLSVFENNELAGIFFGIGKKEIYYSVVAALMIYLLGFLLAYFDQKTVIQAKSSNLASWIPLSLLLLYCIIIIASSQFRTIIHLPIISLLVESILIFLVLRLTRQLLSIRTLRSALTHKKFILIGEKTLTFYITANIMIGFLKFPKDSAIAAKLLILFGLVLLTYCVTAWHFYADLYRKSNLTTQSKL